MEKKKRTHQPDVTLAPKDGHARSAKHKAIVAAAAKEHNTNRSTARLIRNEMLTIRYQMESYVLDQTITANEMRSIRDFANDFLRILKLKKGEFAYYIEIDLANLNKYYKEDRKFNPELALKFGHFFHTPADLWLRVQFKNEMIKFEQETKLEKKYKKYDYEKVLQIA
ncbi:helix-turn-helix transcriptional regulator [Chitinophaga varians]|uniref:helix-turn-helix transcriptional regulator n=1 Tax=Chitinophaga varians TaxID=2202339 RepID=UPI00165EE4BE|nr:transcriptional regulator [Chitinophaga varians]MBC9915163.1 transcriptional regulator [Chitinophaga varians]